MLGHATRPRSAGLRGISAPSVAMVGLAGLLVVLLVLPLAALALSVPPSAIANAALDPAVEVSLGYTLLASGLALLVSLGLGVPLGYLLARREFRGRRLVESVVLLPLVLPHLMAGLALLLVFGPDTSLGRALAAAGFPVWGSLWGVVAVMVYVSTSYLVQASEASFRRVDPEMIGVARTLGASPADAFLEVTLPLSLRAILGGAALSWARALSEIGGFLVLGYAVYPWPTGSHQPVWSPLSILVYNDYLIDPEEAFAVAAFLLLIALGIFLVANLLDLLWARRRAPLSGVEP